MVQGSRGGFAAFFIGRCLKVVFKSRVTSHNNDMSSPLEKGRAKGAGWICPAGASFYVADNVLLAGIVSHAWYEILRLSPHLFWLWLFSHRAFSSAQNDDTGKRKGSHLGDTLHVLELAVLYYDTSRPLETEVPQRDFRVWPNPKRRLACPLRRLPVRPNGPRRRRRMDPRSGVKNYVRLPVSLKRHPDRSGGIFLTDR